MNATALRFAVYSDAELTRVEAFVLDAQEDEVNGRMAVFPFAAESRTATDSNYLFSLSVELTDRSELRDEAVVRFDGYAESKLVLRQTVHVDFTARDTRLVRIWLARTCANELATTCERYSSCDFLTGECRLNQKLGSVPFAAPGLDETSRYLPPPEYVACGPNDLKCPPRNCVHAQDPDCPLELGASECMSDAQCASGNCERGCYGEGCALMRCCQTPCTGPCEYCDDKGICQPFANSDQVSNCGSCGNVCPSGSNGTPSCRAGACALSCAAGFEDCMSGVDGCETDVLNDAQHCGSCAGPSASCRYRLCRDGKCQGRVWPVLGSDVSTEFSALYLRRVVMDVGQVLAVGANFAEPGGSVRLMLLAEDESARPGEILAVSEVPVLAAASADAQGVLHGTEYVFEKPLAPPGAAFWIGAQPLETGVVNVIQIGDVPMEAIGNPATEPKVGAKFSPDEVMILDGSLGASPYVYAVFF